MPDLIESLIRHLEGLTEREAFLTSLQGWLLGKRSHFGREVWDRYGLEQLATIELSTLPLTLTEWNPSEELRALQRVRPKRLDDLAMQVRDILWNGMVLRASSECPGCHHDHPRMLENGHSKLVLACDTCGWTGEGEPIELRPATTGLIRAHQQSSQ